MRILQAVKRWDEETGYLEREDADTRLLSLDCCRRAFIRGCFLAAGSISTPEKFYHLEIVCAREPLAKQIQSVLLQFGIEAKIVLRKRYYVVYVKEGDQISDILNLMDAPMAVMEFENVRILKDVRNRVNRNVNCETANINKTAFAAAQQLESIAYLRDTVGLELLPKGLRAVAQARLGMPEASLVELGESLDPPVGKSGVNHRLRKIRALADQYKMNHDDSATSNVPRDCFRHETNKEE
jgi:DNA-binding protein WhiA